MWQLKSGLFCVEREAYTLVLVWRLGLSFIPVPCCGGVVFLFPFDILKSGLIFLLLTFCDGLKVWLCLLVFASGWRFKKSSFFVPAWRLERCSLVFLSVRCLEEGVFFFVLAYMGGFESPALFFWFLRPISGLKRELIFSVTNESVNRFPNVFNCVPMRRKQG